MNFLLFLIVSFLYSGEEKCTYSENRDSVSCVLEEKLENWNSDGDYELLNSFISRDTLAHQFNPRYGMFINAIARIKVDSLNNSTGVIVEEILLYGDRFESDMFKEYFILQYKAYIYALVDKYPIKKSYNFDECKILIHQQKIRAC